MHAEPIPRNFVLRFPMDADPSLVRDTVVAWNRRFANHCEGAGYFPDEPVIESTLRGACMSFYLYADSRLWDEILQSRTVTPDEPVVAHQVTN